MNRRSTKPKSDVPKGWHAQDIKAAIWKRRQTLSGLGEKNNLHGSTCRAALTRSQPKGEKVISEFLGVPLHELWPDRYDDTGGRIRHVRDDHNREHSETHRLTRAVA